MTYTYIYSSSFLINMFIVRAVIPFFSGPGEYLQNFGTNYSRLQLKVLQDNTLCLVLINCTNIYYDVLVLNHRETMGNP